MTPAQIAHGQSGRMKTSSVSGAKSAEAGSVSRSSNLANIVQEGVAFASCYLQVRLKEAWKPYDALTSAGRFNHYVVDPMFRWHGQNDRIVTTPSLGQVGMQGEKDSIQWVVNGGSHNYAGLYALSPEDESLQRTCLDRLPIADAQAVPLLNQPMLEGLAGFFNADCCYTTTTGYQSNMLGIPAVTDKEWLIVVDEKSHNSIFTGMFMARALARKRFRHNDMAQLQSILEASQGQYADILVVVEGLYSMDGTIPPLDVLYQLKQRFHFTLYADEAHSFGSIGRTGRGCLELWNDLHPDRPVPADVIDIRSGVLSKAVGGLGGFVCATARFRTRLAQRAEELQARGESVTTATMVQTLTVLRQPQRLENQLQRLRDISRFCHEELERQGVRVYGAAYVPMLPVYGGRPSKAAQLSHVLRQLGLVASPVSTPAVEIWESRVRVTLSASYSDEDVNRLLTAIIEASQRIGLSKPSQTPRQLYTSEKSDQKEMVALRKESEEAYQYLNRLLQQQIEQCSVATTKSHAVAAFQTNCGQPVLEAGHAARQQYGLGSGSARWILGTFSPHLEVEELTAQLTLQPAALTYPDSDLGLMSTVAGLCRPILGCRKHYFLLPAKLAATAEEGLRVASKKSGTVCIRYADPEALIPLFGALSAGSDTYLTLYLDTVVDDTYIDLPGLATRLAASRGAAGGITLLLNDADGLGHHGPNRRGIAAAADLATVSQLLSARMLVSGSFYRALGLPGGYLAGDATIIEELRYTSRCYMFTTSPKPFVMAMIREALQRQFEMPIAPHTAKIADLESRGKAFPVIYRFKKRLQTQLGVVLHPPMFIICCILICILSMIFHPMKYLVR